MYGIWQYDENQMIFGDWDEEEPSRGFTYGDVALPLVGRIRDDISSVHEHYIIDVMFAKVERFVGPVATILAWVVDMLLRLEHYARRMNDEVAKETDDDISKRLSRTRIDMIEGRD